MEGVKNLTKAKRSGGDVLSGTLGYLMAYAVLAIVCIILYVKIFLNQSLFNTNAAAPEYSITSMVVPMVAVGIGVGLTIGAVLLIIHFVKGAGTSMR